MWQEFKTFLIKQNALALAIAFVLGAALNTVVQAIVNDVIMPVIGVITPKGEWQQAIVSLGPVNLKVGDLASAVLNFIIIGFTAWRLSKMFGPKDSAPPPVKTCPYCKLTMDPAATRCPHCTSQIAAGAAG
jgi:large conductance mechanosensitive channel